MSNLTTFITGIADAFKDEKRPNVTQPKASQPANRGRAVKGVQVHAQVPTNVIRNGIRTVKRQSIPHSQLRGWRQRGNELFGSYVTKAGGTYPGRIVISGDRFDIFIKDPPDAIWDHPKSACLGRRDGGWYWLHMNHYADNSADAAIGYVEQILSQALAGKYS